MSVKEKIMGILGLTEAEYNKELARHEYERVKAMGCVSEFIDQRGKNTATNWGAAQQALDLQQLKMQQQAAMLHNTAAQQRAQLVNAWNQASVVGQYATPTTPALTLATTNLSGEFLYTIEELNDEGSVYNMPLQTAVDLAINKFGSGWFKDKTTAEALEENSSFWVQVMSKLWQQKRLERQQVRHFDRDEITTAWKILDEDHGNS